MSTNKVYNLAQRFDRRRLKETFLSNLRIQIYFAGIVLCSILSLPDDYRIDKKNILNQWFVKLGWFWTSALILPLLFSRLRSDDREGVANALFRFITSTILWFISVNTFQFFDTATGFDISGHTFLLMFSNLLISSEMKLNKIEDEKNSHINIASRVLTILWDFMLLQTALYYHTMIQKLIAAIWASVTWYMMHILFYERLESPVRKTMTNA